MREDFGDHCRIFDGGDDLKVATTLRAVFEVDSENAFEQARPVHARRCVCVRLCVFTWFLRRTRHQRGQALHEFQRRHLDVRSAVAPGALELQHDITSATAYPSMQA